MFGSKKIKSTSEVIAKFTQEFRDIMEHQQEQYDKAAEIKKQAITAMAVADNEKTMAKNCIENFESMFTCSKGS